MTRFFESIKWFFSGLVKFIGGSKLQYGYGEWYWNPSRAIPGDVITEFPFFTFTYADLHAHMIALPVTILALGWALSVLLRSRDLYDTGSLAQLGSPWRGGAIWRFRNFDTAID